MKLKHLFGILPGLFRHVSVIANHAGDNLPCTP